MLTRHKNIKIAITGLSRAGKTVFITSLIDQLLNQTSSPYKVKFKAPLSNIKRFDYYTLINELKIEHKWPKGTDEISHTLLEFEVKSRFAFLKNNTFTIELIDYPGEWLLDLDLLNLSYKEWSEKTLNILKNIDDAKVREYLKVIDSLDEYSKGEELELKIYEQYKELLVHLKNVNYSQLTPGRFIMPADLVNDPILHFAPLSHDAKAMIEVFQSRYLRYVKEIVKEIHLEHFKGFDRQIVLVDVVSALQNGYKPFSDMKSALKSTLSLYDHKNKNFMSQWFTPSIKKVLFVATKADEVASSQHANYSMLLDDLIEDIRHSMDINHIKTDTQILSSLKSTVSIEKKYEGQSLSFIRGILVDDAKRHDIYPGEMPSRFPSSQEWDVSKYGFKSFLPPQKAYRDKESLGHINMDKAIDKLIGDLL